MRLHFILMALSVSFMCQAQSSYDKMAKGTWIGEIYGGGLQAKKITIVITEARYQNGRGVCEGYSLVNQSNKTFFKGTMLVEADMPILEAFEPNTSPKNGKFHLEIGCYENDEIIDDLSCGTWTSYDQKIKRKIKVRKVK